MSVHVEDATRRSPAPHRGAAVVTVRRGEFWLPGDIHRDADGTCWQEAPAFVQWEAPSEGECPAMVFVHGGGGQSTDWLGYGGTPGWARQVLDHGWAAYLMDRPGYGRSPYDPHRMRGKTVGMSYGAVEALFLGHSTGRGDTPWPWGRAPGDGPVDALVAASGGMLTDTAWSQTKDIDRLVGLLETVGPSVVITHSAGAPAGWGAAIRRPELVSAVVSVEPLGPPYKNMGPRGALTYGLAAVDLGALPAGTTMTVPPVLLVSAEDSGRADDDRRTAAHLQALGFPVTHLDLAEHGLTGNGHGLIFEANNAQVLHLVLLWLQRCHHGTHTDRRTP